MKPAPLGALSSFRSHDVEAIDGTRTRYRSYFQLQGWIKPLVLGLLRSRLEAGFAAMTAGIERRAEELWIHRQSQAGGGLADERAPAQHGPGGGPSRLLAGQPRRRRGRRGLRAAPCRRTGWQYG